MAIRKQSHHSVHTFLFLPEEAALPLLVEALLRSDLDQADQQQPVL